MKPNNQNSKSASSTNSKDKDLHNNKKVIPPFSTDNKGKTDSKSSPNKKTK